MIKELRYILKYEDYQYRINLMLKINKYMYIPVFIILALGIYLSLFRFILISIGFAIILLINILVLPVLMKFLIKDTELKLAINSQNKYFQVEAKGGYKPEYYWSEVYGIENTKEVFIISLYGDKAQIIIPKRIFKSEQEMNETWELIQECYNKYKEDSSGKSPQNAEK